MSKKIKQANNIDYGGIKDICEVCQDLDVKNFYDMIYEHSGLFTVHISATTLMLEVKELVDEKTFDLLTTIGIFDVKGHLTISDVVYFSARREIDTIKRLYIDENHPERLIQYAEENSSINHKVKLFYFS